MDNLFNISTKNIIKLKLNRNSFSGLFLNWLTHSGLYCSKLRIINLTKFFFFFLSSIVLILFYLPLSVVSLMLFVG